MNYVTKLAQGTDIVKLVSRYGPLKKRGNMLLGRCPFCGSKKETMVVDAARQIFYCYACGKSGNAIYFVAEFNGCSFSEAIDLLREREGLELAPEDLKAREDRRIRREQALRACKQAQWVFYSALRSDAGKECREYLLSRGMDEKTMNRFGIGYAGHGRTTSVVNSLLASGFDERTLIDAGLAKKNEAGRLRDMFFDRAMFPITDEFDRVVGFGGRALGDAKPKYLNSPASIVFDKRNVLYGYSAALKDTDPSSPVIACEGYMDAIALKRAGYRKAVASLGTALTEEHRRMIARLGSDVILSYDSDKAGRNASEAAMEGFESMGIETKELDLNPYKDPDETLHEAGAEALREKVAAAERSYMLRAKAETQGIEDAETVELALAKIAASAPEGEPRRKRIRELSAEFGLKPGSVENRVLLLQAEKILGIKAEDEEEA